jgi:hypothetical protein
LSGLLAGVVEAVTIVLTAGIGLLPSLSDRDLAVLRAVAAGRCEMSMARGGSLKVDGLCCCDQFVGPRLASAGLIATSGPRPGPACLTPSGQALLGFA